MFRNHADTERNFFPINDINVGSFPQIHIKLLSAGLYPFHPSLVLLHCCLWESIPCLQSETHLWKCGVFPAQTAPVPSLDLGVSTATTPLRSLCLQLVPGTDCFGESWVYLSSSNLVLHSHQHHFSPLGDSPTLSKGKTSEDFGDDTTRKEVKRIPVFWCIIPDIQF